MRGKIICGVVALCAFFFGVGVVLLTEGTPEQQARRDVARCAEVARVMMSQDAFEREIVLAKRTVFGDLKRTVLEQLGDKQPRWTAFRDVILEAPPPGAADAERPWLRDPVVVDRGALYGWTTACLLGRRQY